MKLKDPDSTKVKLLSKQELEELDARISANADKWLEANLPSPKTANPRLPKSTCGRKPKIIHNPFYGFIGCMTYWGRYPVFALDIMEGIARLDWHDRPIGVGGKSMPLSVRSLAVILESLPIVSNEAVEDLLQLGERHARRYVKAIELIIPSMMEKRPRSLRDDMDNVEPEQAGCDWLDHQELNPPTPDDLKKLHHDLRTFTRHNTAEEYDEEYEAELSCLIREPNSIDFPAREQHPKRAQAVQMILEGATFKAVERETSVSAKTIRKWRNEALAAQGESQAA